MESTNLFWNSELNSRMGQMNSSPRYFLQSELAYNASEKTSPENSTLHREIIENLKPLAHDFQVYSYDRDPITLMCHYQLRASHRGIELSLDIPLAKDEDIRLNTQQALHQTLSQLKVYYVDVIEGFETLLTNEKRNDILSAYFAFNPGYVFYDAEDYINMLLKPLAQTEPDWIIKVETTPLYLDPLPIPDVTPILLKDLLQQADSWQFS